MTTYQASVRVDGDQLTVTRPLTAPERVGDMIESVVYGMTDGGAAQAGVQSVDLTIEASGESETPIGDSIPSTTSQPIPEQPAPTADVDDLT